MNSSTLTISRSVSWGERGVRLFLAFALVLPLLFLVQPDPAAGKLQPALLSLVEERPGETVRLIVGMAGPDASVSGLVESLGGAVVRDLRIINAIAVEMSAAMARRLAANPAVAWVALDGPVIKASAVGTSTVRDEFNSIAYTNNDGSDSWVGDWVELFDDGSPASGAVAVNENRLQMRETGRGARRQVDLSSTSSATLSFDFVSVENGNDFFVVEVSGDGGATYIQLELIAPTGIGQSISRSYDLQDHIPLSADVIVQFRVAQNFGGPGQFASVDNVQVAHDAGGGSSSNTEWVRDEFNAISFGNNDGSAAWLGDWIEINESSGPASGDLSVYNNRLRIKDNYQGLMRSVDLSAATTATLSFEYGHAGFDFSSDYVALEISADGGVTWTEIDRFEGPSSVGGNSIPDLMPISYDISGFIAGNTSIRFLTSYALGNYDYLYVDNVEINYAIDPCPGCIANTYLDTLNVQPVWDMGITGQGIGVAVIDSGISTDADLSISKAVAFKTGSTTDYDSYGHGTHVAGIIAGSGIDSGGFYKGIAPQANLISVAITDEFGMAYESDAVAAMQWVYENKDLYNIRVVNLSFNSTVEQSYHDSALNAAAEILWFNGIVVVASVGNKGAENGYNTANASPANDPFLITVGASHEQGTADRGDDTEASFSAHGTTDDGFTKPDIIAPGKDIISVLSVNSNWDYYYPERSVHGGDYFRLSGTSMAAPMVSSAAALMLQNEPNLTPDQVKYRLLNASGTIGDPLRVSYPYLDVYAAVTTPTTESSNTGLIASNMLTTGSEPITSSVSWNSVSWNSVSWNSVSWNSVSWNSVSWNSVSWNSVSWNE